MKQIVGIKSNNYPEKRNFSGLDVPGFQFEKKIDFYKIPAFIYFRLKNRTHLKWLNLFWNFGWSRAKLYHFFNTINCGNQPWVVTFEYYLPFGAHHPGNNPKDVKYIEFVMKRLAHPSCKKIIAISEFAKSAQVKYFEEFPKYKDVIMSKIEVWLPPQKLYVENMNQKIKNDKLKFTFVGADFFRKGGMEILTVFDELIGKNYKVELVIVSKLQFGDHASGTTVEDKSAAIQIIKKHTAISYFESLSNDKVIELFKTSDVVLLPTYDDTFGYTVLEAQACGCPVISTNGGALTEINNDELGWIINVPLVEDNRSIPRGDKAKSIFQKIVADDLIRIISDLTLNRASVIEKGERCIRNIKEKHDVDTAQRRLNALYNEILINESK